MLYRSLLSTMLAVLVLARPAHAAVYQAKPLTSRTPLITGTQLPNSSELFFGFVHWFSLSAPPLYKVTNVPTFDLAYGLGPRLGGGLEYESNSQLVPGIPNEAEPYLKGLVYSGSLNVSLLGAYNSAANSLDLEAELDAVLGPFTGLLTLRSMTFGYALGPQAASGLGVAWHVLPHLALEADTNKVWSLPGSLPAWSVAVALDVLGSPHTFALEATNAVGDTLEGASLGTRATRYGFAFTIPFGNPGRYRAIFLPSS